MSVVVITTATLVHLATAALIAGAVLLVAIPGGPPVWLRIIGAALLLGLVYFVWPFSRRRRRGLELSRQQAPELFSLIDEVARTINAPTVDSLALSPDFNASYSTRGLRRRVLGIGMSLWTVLGAQEQVALLGHELGHAVNGDYADELAARAGGSEAAIRLTELLLLSDFCVRTVIQAVRFQREADPWQMENEAVRTLPPSEFERRRRLARRKLNRIDVTHPPTQLRADLLRDRPSRQPLVVLDAGRVERIDRELQPFREWLVTRVKDMIGAQ